MVLERERPGVIDRHSKDIVLLQEKASIFKEASPQWLSEWLRPSEAIHNTTGIQIINTRLWLSGLNERLEYKDKGRITIDNIPKQEWKKLFDKYDVFYFMGIYEPSEASREHCLKHIDSFQHALPKENPEQFLGPSPFAPADYELNPQIAPGEKPQERWQKFEETVDYLHKHGKKVIVDFIGDHLGVGNKWLEEKDEQGNLIGPDYFVHGGDYKYVEPDTGKVHWLAHGSDPYFGQWHDTLLLNYGNPRVHQKMEQVLQKLVDHGIDGVRCDMAHLQLKRRFKEMHGNKLNDEQKSFIDQGGLWERQDDDGNTIIDRINNSAKERAKEEAEKQNKPFKEDSNNPYFTFLAEVYEDRDIDELAQFDYVYWKKLYDLLLRLKNNPGVSLDNLWKEVGDQIEPRKKRKPARFTENFDEKRAADPEAFGEEASKAATVISVPIPNGMFMVNLGQEEGRQRKVPVQVLKLPDEPVSPEMQAFYDRILALERTTLLQKGNYSLPQLSLSSPNIFAMQVAMKNDGDRRRSEAGVVVVTNFGPDKAQCKIPHIGPEAKIVVYDLMTGEVIKNPDKNRTGGCYVGLRKWKSQAIFYTKKDKKSTSPAA